jgi:hypothetical protein
VTLPPGWRRLELAADAAIGETPPGADPLGIRSALDWIEPIVDLEPARLRREILRRSPRQIDAWKAWQLAAEDLLPAELLCVPVEAGTEDARAVLAVAARPPFLRLTRHLPASSAPRRLAIVAGRLPAGGEAPILEVRVDGRTAARFEAPPWSRAAPPELSVALPPADREVVVEITQEAAGSGSGVHWRAIRIESAGAAEPPGAR